MSDDSRPPSESNLDLVLGIVESSLEPLVQEIQNARAEIQKAREQGKLSEDSATGRRVFGFDEFLGTLDTAWKKYKAGGSFEPPPVSPVN